MPTIHESATALSDICQYVCHGPKCVGGITWPKHAHVESQFWVVKTDL